MPEISVYHASIDSTPWISGYIGGKTLAVIDEHPFWVQSVYDEA